MAMKARLDAAIAAADLPGNFLDALLNELGGPKHVAEMTGRWRHDMLRPLVCESVCAHEVSLATAPYSEAIRLPNTPLVAVRSCHERMQKKHNACVSFAKGRHMHVSG